MPGALGGRGIRSEINVTPLIDVVLVLLIIFMVLAPTLESRFALALPARAEADEPPPPGGQPLVVSLDAAGTTYLNGREIALEELVPELRTGLRGRDPKVAFFDADDEASYGRAVEVMDACRAAGAAHIGIVDEEATAMELPSVPQ